MSMKNSSDTIGNRTRDLPACSAVPQTTAPPRAPFLIRKGKFTIQPATKALRGSRGTGRLFYSRRHKMGLGGQRHAPAALPPEKRTGTDLIGDWVRLTVGLDGCGKSLPFGDSIPGPCSP
jgi:hypothetical protein